jgi:hypothetical protein
MPHVILLGDSIFDNARYVPDLTLRISGKAKQVSRRTHGKPHDSDR